MQQLAGVINENQFYGEFDEDSVRQMLIDAGKDPQEVDDFMDDEEGYFTWSNMTFDHQPTNDDIKNAFVDAFEEWATGGTDSLYEAEDSIPTVYNKPEWAMSSETAEQIKPIQAFLEENGWVIEETGANNRVHYFTAVKNKTPVNITT